MKVVFLQDVPGTADAGEVKEVANGFARNYLIPQKMAAPATRNQLQRVKAIQRVAGEQRKLQTTDMEVVAELLKGKTITLEARVGPTGRLYGSITPRRIAEELSKLAGRELDHRTLALSQPIHEPGTFPTTVRLYRDIAADVTVVVVPEGQAVAQGEVKAPAAEAPAGEAPAAEQSQASPSVATEGPQQEPEEAEADKAEDQV